MSCRYGAAICIHVDKRIHEMIWCNFMKHYVYTWSLQEDMDCESNRSTPFVLVLKAVLLMVLLMVVGFLVCAVLVVPFILEIVTLQVMFRLMTPWEVRTTFFSFKRYVGSLYRNHLREMNMRMVVAVAVMLETVQASWQEMIRQGSCAMPWVLGA
mgnify:CR=1 FL=1